MPPPKYKTFEIPQGGIVIRGIKGKRGQSRDVGASRHDRKLAMMADPGKGNKLEMTTMCKAAARKKKIIHHATTMTKGRAPTAMMRTRKIQLHIEYSEAVATAEISRRTPRARRGVTPPHPHQATPMGAAVVVVMRPS
jgi:hypothetical protein